MENLKDARDRARRLSQEKQEYDAAIQKVWETTEKISDILRQT